ncbi:ankyrin repeat-containing protein [Legionella wadsworthii]|uniref:Ankyrin repeat-containing protein n=1 Tax=Legionella wadsworthii TaxID=28088 RepID=A0A378LPY1_9GAMM|nr:Dot/Icm T4SS effector AnkQ/LegA10 [Legionella wadsworthii]STY28420.1 ankyrin repeat-containing protein [Legionella wadsworthii]
MGASRIESTKIILSQNIMVSITKDHVDYDEIEALLSRELKTIPAGKAMDYVTDMIHLVSFMKTKQFSNPKWALQIFIDDATSKETRQGLVQAMRMAPESHDPIFNLICRLAETNHLSRFTQISHVTPLRFLIHEGDREHIEEYEEWYLIFDLFGLCKNLPADSIPLVEKLLTTTYLSSEDLLSVEQFFKSLEKFHMLDKKILEPLLPLMTNKNSIENLRLFFVFLGNVELLNLNLFRAIEPFLTQVRALHIFFQNYLLEIKSAESQEETLNKLGEFCRLSLPKKGSYDDVVVTNTPLHQAIIDRDPGNLKHALSFANHQLLLATSYDNTALLLACKLADKKAALLILEQMQQLKCDVNQQDFYGMTALHWARFYHFDDLSAALVSAGADETLKTKNGKKSAYFARHQFTIEDFKIEGREIIEDSFSLTNKSLTDIAFHADKIALNLKLTSPKELAELYQGDEGAQIRSSNRFYLFFKTFRFRFVEWLEKQRALDYPSSGHEMRQRSISN